MSEGVAMTQSVAGKAQTRLQVFLARAARNPRWMMMDTLSRFASVRRASRALRSGATRSAFDVAASMFGGIDPEAFVRTLRQDGFCGGLQIPADTLQKIQSYCATANCYGDANERYGFRYGDKARAQVVASRVFSQATYLFLDGLQPTLDQLANDPLLQEIARHYLAATPVITGVRVWWVFATPEAAYDNSITTSFFHYDKDDYSALRVFFYLSPVDAGSGPHVVARGSHLKKPLSQLVALGERTDAQLVAYYGEQSMHTVCGPAGSGFAEDPFCFHKATRPISGDRLMLEVKYATRNYHIFPYPDRALASNILEHGPPGS
jgi:hypothetical protein